MKKLVLILIITALLLFSVPALAQTYTSSGFTIEIPEGEAIYYFTPDGTNMQGKMLENAQAEAGLSLLTGVYNQEKTLAYSLEIREEPYTGEQTDAAAIRAEKLETLKSTQEEQFIFQEPEQTQIGGAAALMAEGSGSEEEAYAVRIYVFYEEEKIYTVTMLYQKAEGDRYLNEGKAQLGTLKMGAPEPTPEPTVEPAPIQTAPLQREMVVPVEPEKETFPFLYIGMGIVVIAALSATLVILLRKQKKQAAELKPPEEERSRRSQRAKRR